ncbi:hypothetical protein FKP32DRAFT_402459 [Trametes sanguinea]|nr:hypothetical protein FKP32DRAFT_402459 [Trametes sanguinea]
MHAHQIGHLCRTFPRFRTRISHPIQGLLYGSVILLVAVPEGFPRPPNSVVLEGLAHHGVLSLGFPSSLNGPVDPDSRGTFRPMRGLQPTDRRYGVSRRRMMDPRILPFCSCWRSWLSSKSQLNIWAVNATTPTEDGVTMTCISEGHIGLQQAQACSHGPPPPP